MTLRSFYTIPETRLCRHFHRQVYFSYTFIGRLLVGENTIDVSLSVFCLFLLLLRASLSASYLSETSLPRLQEQDFEKLITGLYLYQLCKI